jgi:hypothetical protein
MKRALAMALWALAAWSEEPRPVAAGRVVDAQGTGLRKVRVLLEPVAAGAPYAVASDAEGRFEFYGVPAGRYRLRGERAGYVTATAGGLVRLDAGHTVEGLALRLAEQAAISGRVVSEMDMHFWLVELHEQRYRRGQRIWACRNAVHTGTDGEFAFWRLPAGRYRLVVAGGASRSHVNEQDGQRLSHSYYPGVTEASKAGVLEVHAGETVSGLLLPALQAPAGRLSGSVVRRPRYVTAYLAETGSDAAWPLELKGDRFERRLPAGTYVVGVLERDAHHPRLLAWQTVTASGDTEAPPLDLEAVAVAGTLKGAPAGAKLRVKLTPVDDPLGHAAVAEAADDGAFTVRGTLVGRFQVSVEGLPEGGYLDSALYGEKDVLDGVALERGSQAQLKLAVRTDGAELSGTVRDARGAAVEARVTAVADPAHSRVVSTDGRGRFRLSGLKPGRYRVQAWEEFEDGAVADPAATAARQEGAVVVELPAGGRKAVELAR